MQIFFSKKTPTKLKSRVWLVYLINAPLGAQSVSEAIAFFRASREAPITPA